MIEEIEKDWSQNPRWKGIKRGYGTKDVVRLRGSVQIEHTLAKRGAEKLWKLCAERPYVHSLGALTGNQAVQQVRAGVPAIYLSGWQVAADANDSLHMYPDQSLYAVSSVPTVVRRINNALLRADQIQWMEGKGDVDFLAPIVADAEAGFGGVLNAYELMRSMIDAGTAGVHFEDQLASVKKCGHMGGKVLVPTAEAVQKGRSLFAGRIGDPPDSFGGGAVPYKYRIEVFGPPPFDSWQPLTNPITVKISEWFGGIPLPCAPGDFVCDTTLTPTDDGDGLGPGWYEYLEDIKGVNQRFLVVDKLASWHTTPAMEGLWRIRITAKDPSIPLLFPGIQTVRVRIDNTPPSGPAGPR